MTECAAVRAGSPRRRLLTVVVLGAIALGTLVGCRTEAGTALYVGDTRITEAQVDTAAAAVPDSSTRPSKATLRNTAIADLAFIALAKLYAADHQLALPGVSADYVTGYATSLAVTKDPSKNPFVVASATALTYANFLITKGDPVTPTDAEMQPGFNSAVANGVVPAGQFTAYKTQLLQVQGIQEAFGMRRALVATADKYHVTVNPRYAPVCASAPCSGIEFPLLPLQASTATFDAVLVPIGGAATNPAVVDQVAPAAAAPAPAGQNAP